MGHEQSRQKIQLEKIIQEVKDIQLYIRQNVEEFDDKCRDNLHQRLIEYSHSLQDIFQSAKKKNSKECKEATQFVINVLDELYKQKPLDSGSVETNSFIHVTSKDAALWESGQKINGEKKQTRSTNQITSQSNHIIPSLEDIRVKTLSLKNEMEIAMKSKDINQLKMQQKIVQILATDLEMLCIENYTPSYETKEALEKELNLMYRRIEKAKKRHYDAMQFHQEKVNASTGEVAQKVVSVALEEKLPKIGDIKDNVTQFNQDLYPIDDVNLHHTNAKSNISVKNNPPVSYLGIQDEYVSDFIINEHPTQQENLQRDSLLTIRNICSGVDQCMSQAKNFIKTRSFENLAQLKNQLFQYSDQLQKCSSTDKDVMTARLEVENKIKNTLEFFESWLNGSDAIKEIKRTDENLEKAKNLIRECWDDIMKFNHTTSSSGYVTYNKHLDGLESFLNKVTLTDERIIARKAECLKDLLECRKHLNNIYKANMEQTFASTKYKSQLTNKAIDDINSGNNIIESDLHTNLIGELNCQKCDTNHTDESGVVLRQKALTSVNQETKLRTIEGFYAYWRELQSNLPSHNCTYEKLHEIVAFLRDIEAQIGQKRSNIESFLLMKEQKCVSFEREAYRDCMKRAKVFTQVTNANALKTNARIYTLNEAQNLTPDDDKTLQTIDQMNDKLNKIVKQNPEKVFLQDDGPSVEPGVLKKIGCTKKATRGTKEKSVTYTDALRSPNTSFLDKVDTHDNFASGKEVDCISQIDNITTNVQHLRKKAILFCGSKQTPIYTEIKAKLDSYRKTVNVLISYQNENMTLSCNRLLKRIDEVIEILNTNSESSCMELPQLSLKKSTIEILFKDIIEMQSRLEDIANTVAMLDQPVKKEVYLSIQDELLRNRKVLHEMKISGSYVVILNTKASVMKEIDNILYNLNIKSERYKTENQVSNQSEEKQRIMTEFKKIKEKVNRFYGTYKNVLYREIEKNIDDCLNKADNLYYDERFVQSLREDAILQRRILKQKSIGNHNCEDSEHENDISRAPKNIPSDIGMKLSNIGQNYEEIKNKINSTSTFTDEMAENIRHRINTCLTELTSIDVADDKSVDLHKDKLRKDFLKLSTILKNQPHFANDYGKQPADGSNSQTSTLTLSVSDTEAAMSNIEDNVKTISQKIEDFKNNKCSTEFFNLDEGLTKLSMNVYTLTTTKGTDLHKKKIKILKGINACYEILESKAQSYEIFQNVETKVKEVEYRLHNFHNLSDGDYSALYKELIDLDDTLKDLDVTGKIAEERVACQKSIQQCLMTLGGRNVNQNATDSSSEDGTSV